MNRKLNNEERFTLFMRGWTLGAAGYSSSVNTNADFQDGHASGVSARTSAETAAAGRYNLDFRPVRAGAEQTPTVASHNSSP